LVVKIFPEGANAARELARHFSNPGPINYCKLGKYVGYLKSIKAEIKLTYRKPKESRALSYVDSNYATDKEDRRSVSGGIHTVLIQMMKYKPFKLGNTLGSPIGSGFPLCPKHAFTGISNIFRSGRVRP
jgi:hypothetical protein